jgi:glycolate oxidase subunit GlcD
MRSSLRRELLQIVGEDNLLTHPAQLLVYECDGLTFHRAAPDAVVFPRSAQQVQKLMKLACRLDIPVTARGAGTSLSGGAIALQGGILLETSRMNQILEINQRDRYALVEPGVVNLDLSLQAKPFGLQFAPDPSSQSSCTLGGNIATNAGGPHCLKYGTTVQHVLGLEMVTSQGEIMVTGSPAGYHPGFDLTGLITGSEGTLGMVTKIWVRLIPLPREVKTWLAAFSSLGDATRAVSRIIASGTIPAAMEMMDQLAVRAVENSVYAAGYPTDAVAVLLLEIDGFPAETAALSGDIREILEASGAVQVREACDDAERARLWAGRKGAFGAFGRIARNLYLQDTVVPRTKLTEVLQQVCAVAVKYNLPLVNVFHAGDGNLHPVLLFDGQDQDQLERVHSASREIVQLSVKAGGTLTGEHGIGVEKLEYLHYLFSEEDLAVMERIRHVFDSKRLCNPGKLLPMKSSHSSLQWS